MRPQLVHLITHYSVRTKRGQPSRLVFVKQPVLHRTRRQYVVIQNQKSAREKCQGCCRPAQVANGRALVRGKVFHHPRHTRTLPDRTSSHELFAQADAGVRFLSYLFVLETLRKACARLKSSMHCNDISRDVFCFLRVATRESTACSPCCADLKANRPRAEHGERGG
jgi:hypothetical protein